MLRNQNTPNQSIFPKNFSLWNVRNFLLNFILDLILNIVAEIELARITRRHNVTIYNTINGVCFGVFQISQESSSFHFLVFGACTAAVGHNIFRRTSRRHVRWIGRWRRRRGWWRRCRKIVWYVGEYVRCVEKNEKFAFIALWTCTRINIFACGFRASPVFSRIHRIQCLKSGFKCTLQLRSSFLKRNQHVVI